MFKSKFLPVFTFLFIAVLASCNFNSRKTSSIYLDLSGIKAKVIGDKSDTERKLIDDYTDTDEENIKPLFVDIEITEGFEFKETIDLHKQVTLEIAEVPVGTRVKAKIDVYTYTTYEYQVELQEFYFEEASKNMLYSGESKPRVISGGPNSIIITLQEFTNKIYVTYNEESQGFTFDDFGEVNDNGFYSNLLSAELSEGRTGTSAENGFFYIQSAIEWIAKNGKSDKNYEIILTGYDEGTPFQQNFIFGQKKDEQDNLYDHAKSIFITSDNPDIPALKTISSNNIIVATRRDVIFKNILIEAEYRVLKTSNEQSTACNITFDYGTNLTGLDNNSSGAIELYNYSTLTMQGNSIISGFNNSGSGGAISIDNGTFTMKDDSVIDSCSASSNGGAAALYNGSINITGNAIIQDCSANYGGALWTYQNTAASITISDNAKITSCSATYDGGAIYIQHGNLTLNSGLITDCEAGSSGGAIYTYYAVYIQGGTISDNKARYYGGAIYMDTEKYSTGPTVDISGGIIENNSVTEYYGSAIYMKSRATGITGAQANEYYANLILSGDAYINPNNDIYISDPGQVHLTLNSLTSEEDTVALITYNTASNNQGIFYNSTSENIEKSFSKICINPTTEIIDSNQIEHNWYINENGELKEVDYILEEADAIQLGDLVFADNTRVRPEKYPYLTYQLRTSLAGIVFYAGTEDAPLGEVNLIVGTETMYGKYDSANRSSTAGHTVFDLTAQVSNFDITDSYPYVYETSSFIDISDAVFTSYALGNSSLNSTDTLNNSWAVIKDTVDSILQGTDTYYDLYEQVINYGNSFSESIYSIDTNDETNNWYIPTIYEYTLFYEAFNNETFTNIYNKKCGEMKNEYISATGLHYGNITLPQFLGFNVLNFSIRMDEHIIRCYNTGNYAYCIPIHTYSL